MGLNFNIHSQQHIYRAAQEGIAFAFRYGIDIMQKLGIKPDIIRAGNANMFLSPVFRETLAGVTGARIELYNTDGAEGAARGAGLGLGFYSSEADAFGNLVKVVDISVGNREPFEEAYQNWLAKLEYLIKFTL